MELNYSYRCFPIMQQITVQLIDDLHPTIVEWYDGIRYILDIEITMFRSLPVNLNNKPSV